MAQWRPRKFWQSCKTKYPNWKKTMVCQRSPWRVYDDACVFYWICCWTVGRAVDRRSVMKPTNSAIRTYTGALFDFEHPEKSPISIEDIAHSLSLLCRFAGHCKEFYCVTPNTKVLTQDLTWIPAKN